jgi:hypothetical protein
MLRPRRLLLTGGEAARAGTARITVTAVALVLGLSSAAVLPLLLPWRGAVVLGVVSMLLSAMPFIGFWLVARRRGVVVLEPARFWVWASGVMLASGLSMLPLFELYRGQVRVLNHGDEPFALFVDGKRVARVEPSSGESALAGAWLTLPAGLRDLRVVAEGSGRELFRARELVQGGSPHLFAPQSAGYCFTIEQRGYGDAKGATHDSQPLDGSNPFWVLPDGITWFTPNPEPGPLQTSGGTLSCLRQKRCTN